MSHRHRPAAPIAQAGPPPTVQPAAPPPAEAARVPLMFGGMCVGDLRVEPGTDAELLTRALARLAQIDQLAPVGQLATHPEWDKLGADLAALGPHRLAIAARAATAAAGGGHGVSAEEEDRIAQWFGGIVDEAIRRGGLPAAVAIWTVLAGDSHAHPADPDSTRSPRCPAIAEVPLPPKGFSFEPGEPGEPGKLGEPGDPGDPGDKPGEMTPDPDEVATFLDRLRAAAPGYVHAAIACASDADLRELREIALADDHALEKFRPWVVELATEAPASESLEDARSMLTYRHLSNAEACSRLADWAHGCAGMVVEHAHALTPVLRISAVAWLARVVLELEEDVARVLPQPEEGAVQDPHAPPHVRHLVALEAAGWHVVALRPNGTDERALWRVSIERYDENMTITLREAADPDVALEELVRYVQVDAK